MLYNISDKTKLQNKKRGILMAKILSQYSVFDYMEIEHLGDLERLQLCFDAIDDTALVAALKTERGHGRDDYPVEVMLNLFYAMKVFGHKSIESFRRECLRNSQLRFMCGLYAPCKRKHLVPPARVFSKFIDKLMKYQDKLNTIFQSLVDELYQTVDGFGQTVAGDGKIIQSYANAQTDKTDTDRRSETEATWTKKVYYYTDSSGKECKKSTSYFGYRAHILCDVKTELPIKLTVTPANIGEKDQMKKMLTQIADNQKDKMKYVLLDRGYDSTDLYQAIIDMNALPIIDKRNMWQDNNETRQYKDTDIVYDVKGNVYYVDENIKKTPMKYKGYDKQRDALRYEHNGKIYRIKRKENERIFTPLARQSKKFKRLYKGRTAVERLNGRLDRDYNFEDHCIRGLKKMTMLVTFSAIIMLAMAKGHIAKKQKNYASLYQFA